MRTKLLVLFSALVVVLCGLLIRLMYIDYKNGDVYTKKVLTMQSYNSTTIPFQRGNITDRNGTTLAANVAMYNVILDSYVLNENEDAIEPTLRALEKYFGADYDTLKAFIQDKPNNRYKKVLDHQLSYSEIQEFQAMEDETDEDGNKVNNITGVWFETEYERTYPFGSLASDVIGFVSSGNVGTTGLENYYDDELNGVNGREYGYLNSDNDFEKTVINAQDGNNLVTTLDANIQMIVEEKLQEFYDVYTNNAIEGGGYKEAACIVMNPNTGEILAMADSPNFDLNNPRDLTAYFTSEEIEEMTSDDTDTTASDFLNQMWQNYCVSSSYEPGSVQKPMTVATGLETGTLDDSMTFICDGAEYFDGYPDPVKCVNTLGHGEETLEEALMDSCNDALMQMSYKIGVHNFATYQSIFNFGQKTGIDLPGEASCSTLIYNEDTMSKIDLATNSFGQNYNCTMIQMVSAFSSVINGGHYYLPHIVSRITDSAGNTVREISPVVLKETISESTSDQVRGYLEQVVAAGTGSTAKVDGYSMGGKTGTAEKTPRGTGNYVVSFCGFAPADDPQVVVYVVIDQPNAEDQAHSSYAQNIAREIFKEILPYMNIYPDEEENGTNDLLDITGNNPPVYTATVEAGSFWDKTAAESEEDSDATDTTDEDGETADTAASDDQ